jgi:hypothetical protein
VPLSSASETDAVAESKTILRIAAAADPRIDFPCENIFPEALESTRPMTIPHQQ